MNEPPNPPPSDSTPPPPPPPPFTPPPSPPQPAPTPSAPAPSAAEIPRPPIYVPSAAPPAKKSSMPWVLGGCGCLVLLFIIAALIGFSVYRASKKVTELKSDFKSALESANQPSPSTTSKAGWTTYTNLKENLPAGLQPNFIAFSFEYPKSFELQPQGKINFVKVEKYAAVGKGNTAENFAVGYASFNPPNAESAPLYEKLLDDLGHQLAGGFHNYRELKRMSETVGGVKSRAATFQADFNDADQTQLWGKTIVVHPPGKEKGVTILLLGTSLSRDIKSADDLGVKGESAEILRSFRFQ